MKSKGYASWHACLKRQELLRGNGHTQNEGGRWKGDEGSTDKETTHGPARPQAMPPQYNGEQNGGGLHPNTWQSKGGVKPETTTTHYPAKLLETPIPVNKYQEILDYWFTHGKQEPPQGGKSQSTTTHDSTQSGLEFRHHHQYRHRHRNENSHRPRPSLHAKGAHAMERSKVHAKNFKPNREKDDEEVWFRVPGDMDVKLSQPAVLIRT